MLSEKGYRYRDSKAVIQEVPPNQWESGVYSRFLLVTEKNKDLRPVLYLSKLSHFVKQTKLWMVMFTSFEEGQLDVFNRSQGCLPSCNDSKVVQVKSEPEWESVITNSEHCPLVSPPSQVFAKCMAVMAAWLRLQGFQVFPYVDDWLLTTYTRLSLSESGHLYSICISP